MKHLFLLFLLIPVTLFAQVDKKYLAGAVPVVDDRVVFTEELNLPDVLKMTYSPLCYNGRLPVL